MKKILRGIFTSPVQNSRVETDSDKKDIKKLFSEPEGLSSNPKKNSFSYNVHPVSTPDFSYQKERKYDRLAYKFHALSPIPEEEDGSQKAYRQEKDGSQKAYRQEKDGSQRAYRQEKLDEKAQVFTRCFFILGVVADKPI